MMVEQCKFYRTRSGSKIGPMRFDGWIGMHVDTNGNGRVWMADGRVFAGKPGGDPFDIVTEWSDEPPAPPEPKAIDQMTLADYRNGVASIWNSYRHI